MQNTTEQLVNYELRRKMRKVGVQVQHIGTRLSWQVFLDAPGTTLGLGELVHVVPAPDLSGLSKPDPLAPLLPKETEFSAPFTCRVPRHKERPAPGRQLHPDPSRGAARRDHRHAQRRQRRPYRRGFRLHRAGPSPGYTLDVIRLVSAKTQGGDAQFLALFDWLTASTGRFRLKAQFLNFGGGRIINFTLAITWQPPSVDPLRPSTTFCWPSTRRRSRTFSAGRTDRRSGTG